MALLRALIPAGLEDDFDASPTLGAAADVARSSGAALEAWIAGAGPDEEIAHQARAFGARSVELLAHPGLSGATADAYAQAFAQALRDPRIAGEEPAAISVLPATSAGDEIAARLAFRTGGAALGRCAAVELAQGRIRARRAAFGGRALATLECEGPAFACMRATKREVAQNAGMQGTVRRWDLEGALERPFSVSRRAAGEKKRRIEGARVVVSGGRGMGGAEGFALLEELADCLGGAVGGSLPTVDAGWVPVARQVGQSGKFVAPEVYVAVAVSGTPQHLAGVSPDARIVAINKDSGAPIFGVAEIGLVADWREALRPLVETLKRAPR